MKEKRVKKYLEMVSGGRLRGKYQKPVSVWVVVKK